jgi:hypothetical protein
MKFMDNIIADIEDLRTNHKGERHGYFFIGGTPTRDDFVIDTVDICKALAPYEIDYDTEFEVDMNELGVDDKYVWYQPDIAERYIDYLVKMKYIEDWDKAGSDNSYNWESPVSNDVSYFTFKSLVDDSIYVLFKVHRWGDVRGNYTDNCILKFDDAYEWFEAFDEVNRNEYVQVNGQKYCVEIDFWREGFEVYNEAWDYICTVYGCYDRKDVVEAIKDHLEKENK